MEYVKIKNLRRKDKGVLVASFDVEMPERKIQIRDCTFFSNHNGDWINFPSRRYEQDGQTKYFSYVLFTDEDWAAVSRNIAEHVRKELDGSRADQQNMELNVDF